MRMSEPWAALDTEVTMEGPWALASASIGPLWLFSSGEVADCRLGMIDTRFGFGATTSWSMYPQVEADTSAPPEVKISLDKEPPLPPAGGVFLTRSFRHEAVESTKFQIGKHEIKTPFLTAGLYICESRSQCHRAISASLGFSLPQVGI